VPQRVSIVQIEDVWLRGCGKESLWWRVASALERR